MVHEFSRISVPFSSSAVAYRLVSSSAFAGPLGVALVLVPAISVLLEPTPTRLFPSMEAHTWRQSPSQSPLQVRFFAGQFAT